MTQADALTQWIGRRQERRERLTPWPLAALAATLDREEPAPVDGDPLPAGAHWLYFLEAAPLTRLGPDGHPRRGAFLPPVALPRRMWAGGRLIFQAPLRVGWTVSRVSEVADVRVRQGRSGELVFVLVRHTFTGPDGVALIEEHEIVYRDHPLANSPPPPPLLAPTRASWSRTITPTPVLLFRYSALTFNGHRIHYDQHYATAEEGYPGLVVHGPLLATLLLDLLAREGPRRPLAEFRYRLKAPLFHDAPFTLAARPDGEDEVLAWVKGPAGELALEASARFFA